MDEIDVEVLLHEHNPAHGLWIIGKNKFGKHYATRDVLPRFCLTGSTTEEVEKKAGEAIESYFRLMDKADG